jgi:hypothetical protein
MEGKHGQTKVGIPTSYTHQEQAEMAVHHWLKENNPKNYKTPACNKTTDHNSQNSNSISPKKSAKDALKCNMQVDYTTAPDGIPPLNMPSLKNLFLISVTQRGITSIYL